MAVDVITKEEIEKPRNEPKEGMEYVYLHDMAWPLDGIPHSVDFEYGSIVTNVQFVDNFVHFIGNDGIEYKTYYDWSFAENTPNNRKKIEKLSLFKNKMKKYKEKLDSLIHDINRLQK